MPKRSRREFLAAAGATLTAGLAGCNARPPDSGSIETVPPSERGVDRTPTVEGNAYTDVYREAIGSVGLVRVYDDSGALSQGSGFVFRDNFVVTNQHVVDGGTTFEVEFKEGEWVAASLVGSDVYSDLAVLRLLDRPDYAEPLSFVSREPPVGTRVVVLGAPFGLSHSVSAGIISGQDRSLPSGTGFRIADAIQTDAAVNPGNSGGPLVNLDGEVVGVINSGGGENIGFAISAGLCRRVLPALVDRGEYDHAFMGVRLLGVSPTVAKANDLEQAQGVLVVEVMDGGPSAGVLQSCPETQTVDGTRVPVGGDVIVSMGGQPTPTTGALSEYLALKGSPGETIPVTVLRDGTRTTVELTLGERPEPN